MLIYSLERLKYIQFNDWCDGVLTIVGKIEILNILRHEQCNVTNVCMHRCQLSANRCLVIGNSQSKGTCSQDGHIEYTALVLSNVLINDQWLHAPLFERQSMFSDWQLN